MGGSLVESLLFVYRLIDCGGKAKKLGYILRKREIMEVTVHSGNRSQGKIQIDANQTIISDDREFSVDLAEIKEGSQGISTVHVGFTNGLNLTFGRQDGWTVSMAFGLPDGSFIITRYREEGGGSPQYLNREGKWVDRPQSYRLPDDVLTLPLGSTEPVPA